MPVPTQAAADIVIDGTIGADDRGTIRDLAFDVPADVTQVRVAFTLDGPDGTQITLGVADPQRDRGWGGGIKKAFVINDTFATASFLPGPIPAGRWRLTMTVASMRPGGRAKYRADIRFTRRGDPTVGAFPDAPVAGGAGWYHGDLHSHTGHSDARCRSLSGANIPCPLFLTTQAGADAGLDFLAVTDHNVTSHFAELVVAQTYFDTLVLLPGREITTRFGHANLIGSTAAIDLSQAGAAGGSVNPILKAAHETGGFLSINHPATPTGEDCLGCGWVATDTDYRLIDGVEIANGDTIDDFRGDPYRAMGAHLRFWESLLDRGYRLTGVGGSDNHDAVQGRQPQPSPIGRQSPVGVPATVVHACARTGDALVAGLKRGRVFVDIAGRRDRLLDMTLSAGARDATMGDMLAIGAARDVRGTIHVRGAAGAHAVLRVGGSERRIILPPFAGDDATVPFRITGLGRARWVRADVIAADGATILVGNPVYLQRRADPGADGPRGDRCDGRSHTPAP
ncbi:CehA/McbA family metallohydrolase [Sphingomonas sp. Leaf4]|uniref:CehA/McbA family metallohydrolase n=1 Tax=Sphingomonas sp. Leaf4 TaxID=2876553 RepID=UPI001E43C1E8|nr:CehA/McbA family metallohydrolase [Sphingomonas sp. Leaf4]